jgi:hypothetical protein
MAGLYQRHGPVRLSQQPAFESLADAIVSQQISGRAAEAIMNRLRSRLPVEPESLAKANVRTLRAAGLSRAKTVYLRELARFAATGGLEGIESLPDAEVVERLTSVKGIRCLDRGNVPDLLVEPPGCLARRRRWHPAGGPQPVPDSKPTLSPKARRAFSAGSHSRSLVPLEIIG